MWKKHVLLPLLAGLVSYVPTLNARDLQHPPKQGLYFIENKGQITDQHQRLREDLDFKLNAGPGLHLFLGKGKIVYQWTRPQASPPIQVPSIFDKTNEADDPEVTYDLYRMEVALIGANPEAKVITAQQVNFRERYYLPWIPNPGITVGAYEKITYQNVYPNIDWVFYFNANGQLEHDFVVKPGGHVADIRMQYDGTTSLGLQVDGSLLATTPLGKIREHPPVAYTTTGESIPARFLLTDNTIGFDVAPYSGTLVIDPVIEWGTYFGGADAETGKALTTDPWGNLYVTGTTGSLSNIASTGAYQTTYGGGSDGNGADAFLSKWDKDGHLIWSTYYGGSNLDIVYGITGDASDKVYIAGYTNSKDGMSTPGAHQEIKAGTNAGFDVFIAQFDSSGQRQWGSYFGGTGADGSISVGLCTDRSANVIITGHTASTNGIASSGAYQPVKGSVNDAFLAKFNEQGKVLWSTYYGGNSNDYGYGCVTDSAGNIYLTGYTHSTTGIATSNAQQSTLSGTNDAFVSKFNAEGLLLWSTYLGGEGKDLGYSIVLNKDRLYIGGATLSTAGLATPGAHQAQNGGGEDGMIAALDTAGTVAWITYYGGEQSESISGIWCNHNDELYICGPTTSKTGFTTPDALKENIQGIDDEDIFIGKLNREGERIWGTYYGGLSLEYYGYITGDQEANIYVSGMTSSTTAIATANAYQNALQGERDAFILRINDCPKPEKPSAIFGNTRVCDSAAYVFSLEKSEGMRYHWMLPDAWMPQRLEDSLIQAFVQGTGVLKVVAINKCGAVSDTLSVVVQAIATPQPAILQDNFVLSTMKTYARYQWQLNEEDIPGATQPTYLAKVDGSYSVRVYNDDSCANTSAPVLVTGTLGIEELENERVHIYPNPFIDKLFLEAARGSTLNVWSIEGKSLIQDLLIRNSLQVIPVNNWASGVYILQLLNGNKRQYHMLIKE